MPRSWLRSGSMPSAWRSSKRRGSSDQLFPDLLDLLARCLPAAAVVDHVVRERALFLDRHLRRDHRAGPLFTEAAPLGQALELDLFGHVDEQHSRIKAGEVVFEEQRYVLKHHPR